MRSLPFHFMNYAFSLGWRFRLNSKLKTKTKKKVSERRQRGDVGLLDNRWLLTRPTTTWATFFTRDAHNISVSKTISKRFLFVNKKKPSRWNKVCGRRVELDVKIEIWGEVAQKAILSRSNCCCCSIEIRFKVELKLVENFHEQVNHETESDDARLMVTNVGRSDDSKSKLEIFFDWLPKA